MRDYYLRQEAEESEGVADRVSSLDAIAACLMAELRDAADAFPDYVRQAAQALDLFPRLTLGQLLLRAAKNSIYLTCCPWLAAHTERFGEFTAGSRRRNRHLGLATPAKSFSFGRSASARGCADFLSWRWASTRTGVGKVCRFCCRKGRSAARP